MGLKRSLRSRELGSMTTHEQSVLPHSTTTDPTERTFIFNEKCRIKKRPRLDLGISEGILDCPFESITVTAREMNSNSNLDDGFEMSYGCVASDEVDSNKLDVTREKVSPCSHPATAALEKLLVSSEEEIKEPIQSFASQPLLQPRQKIFVDTKLPFVNKLSEGIMSRSSIKSRRISSTLCRNISRQR